MTSWCVLYVGLLDGLLEVAGIMKLAMTGIIPENSLRLAPVNWGVWKIWTGEILRGNFDYCESESVKVWPTMMWKRAGEVVWNLESDIFVWRGNKKTYFAGAPQTIAKSV